MPNTTAAADPVSHYEVLSTLWAAAFAARGTDLRGQSFVNLDVPGPVPHGFVPKLVSKLRPAGVEYRLGQAGSGQSTGIDIAYAYTAVIPYKSCGQSMKEVPAPIRDLGMDSPHPGPPRRALCDSERPLVFAVNARRLDFLPRGERRQEIQAEIYTDLAGAVLPVIWDLRLQIKVPATAGVLREVAATNLPGDGSADPQPILASKEGYRTAGHADRARRLERNPPQRIPATPSGTPASCVSRNRELLADRLNGIRVQPKQLTAAGTKIDQIESRRPTPIVPPSSFLNLTAVIPDLIYGPRLSLKMPAGNRILDSVPVCQHHANMVIDTHYRDKVDAKNPAETFTLHYRL